MRRFLISVAALLAFTVGVAPASADGSGSTAKVRGTIVTVDPTAGTFVADAYVATSGNEYLGASGASGSTGSNHHPMRAAIRSGPEPTVQRVTISTNASTAITTNGQTVSVASLQPGQHFLATFTGSASESLAALTANPALTVAVGLDRADCAAGQRTLYAFAGSVGAIDPTADTVTVTVTASTPDGLIAAGAPATFTVGPDTTIFGATKSGAPVTALSRLSVGDIVAGGLFGPSGLTAAQFESAPLAALVDIPASGGPTPAVRRTRRTAALRRAERMVGIRSHRTSGHRPRRHPVAH